MRRRWRSRWFALASPHLVQQTQEDDGTSVFVIGVCVGPSDRFERICRPSLREWAPDALLVPLRNQPSIFAAYNAVLDVASEVADLDGVLLIHDDVQFVGDVLGALRRTLAQRDVGLVGTVGGTGRCFGMSWFSREIWRGDLPEERLATHGGEKCGDVDVIDGFLMALSAEVAHQLRYDLSDCKGFHRYDAELSSMVSSLGRRIVVHPLPALHVNEGGVFGSRSSYTAWARSNLKWRLKWHPIGPVARAVTRVRIRLMPVELRLRPAGRRRLRTLPRR